jgi:3-hydroxyacyl-[acyl-carrier-protein] dehydratase
VLDIVEIQKIIPHRAPFLLIDRVLELEDGKRAVGLKNVSGNEPFFSGHFPGQPIMPGVLILEALAQLGAVALLIQQEYAGKLALFAGLDEVKFKRQVVPGDQLLLQAEIQKMRGNFGFAQGQAFVGTDLAASGLIKFAIVPRGEDRNSG